MIDLIICEFYAVLIPGAIVIGNLWITLKSDNLIMAILFLMMTYGLILIKLPS